MIAATCSGIDELVERQVELGLPVARAGIGRVGAAGRPVAVRVGRVVHGARQRLERGPIDVLGRGQGHRLGGPAVVAVPEGHDRRAARRHARELDRRLDRLGARVRQERLPGPTGQHGPQPVVQPQARFVVEDVLLAVQQFRGLGLDRGDDPRMRVAGVGDADPGRVVEVALAVTGDEPGPLATVDVEVRDPAPDRRHDRVVGEGTRLGCGTGVGSVDHRWGLRARGQARVAPYSRAATRRE